MAGRGALHVQAVAAAVALLGEPFRGAMAPDELPALLARHGMTLERDDGFGGLAVALLPAPWRWLVRDGRRLAVGERTATASCVTSPRA